MGLGFEIWLGGIAFLGNGFEDVDWVTTSEGVFASGVGVVYILRHDEGGQGSVVVKFCVVLIRVKWRAA